jgi:hypothetical protein
MPKAYTSLELMNGMTVNANHDVMSVLYCKITDWTSGIGTGKYYRREVLEIPTVEQDSS